MKVDHCLILAAGYGTRMGKIGEILPKVMWPIFEKSMLELQVFFAKQFGINNIAINVHHQSKLILELASKINSFEGVNFLVEDEILDIGGAIHNFAKTVGYRGNLLVINADQFLMFNKDFIKEIYDEGQVATLMTYQVESASNYNELIVENNRLIEVIKKENISHDNGYITYSGNSLVNLSKLERIEGKTPFFESVANYKNKKILCVNAPFEYIDFGTKKRYWDSIHKTLKNNHPNFLTFLKESHSINTFSEKYEGHIYVTDAYISLDGSQKDEKKDKAFLYYEDIEETIS